MGANARSLPVLNGSVAPDGIDLTSTVAHPSEIFWRQLHFQEFDVSKMSLSSLLMAVAPRLMHMDEIFAPSTLDL